MPKTRKTEATEATQKQILTARDVAAVLGVGVCRVHQMLAAGELPSVRVGSKGGGVRIPRKAFDAYLAAVNASACASLTADPFAALRACLADNPLLADILAPSEAERQARHEQNVAGFLTGLRNLAPRG